VRESPEDPFVLSVPPRHDGLAVDDDVVIAPRPGPQRRLPTAAVLMREYVRNGRSLRSVAQDHGLSVGELRELIVGYGLPLHQGVVVAPNGTDALTPDYLQREYVDRGRSAKDIAAEVGVSEQSVLRYLSRAGISARRGGSGELSAVLTEEFLRREYVEGGRGAKEIAAEVGVSEQSVLRYLRRHGFKARTTRPSSLGEVLTVEYLEREHVEGGRSVADLAAEHGVSEQAIRNWINKRGLGGRAGTRARVGDRLTYAVLHREYQVKGRSIADIADEVGVSEQSVLRYLHKHGIPVRRGRAATPLEPETTPGRPAWLERVLTEELLQREYVERGRSAREIAATLGVSEQSVLRYLHRHDIEVRAGRGAGASFSREYLEREYVERERSLSDIGREHGVTGETVRKWLQRYGIERRHTERRAEISDDDLVRRYLAGQTVARIAADLGVSATTVSKRLGAAGVERRRSRPAAVTGDHLHREYVERGRTMAEIGADLGVSATTVRKYLDRFGIAARPKNSQPLLERVLSREFLEREYVEGGRTARAVAEEVGVSEQTVLRYLHRHGLPVRAAGFGHAEPPPSGGLEIPAHLFVDGVPDEPLPSFSAADVRHGDDEEEALRRWLLGGSQTAN
jgi:predicted transcriptional regulator